MESCPIPPEWQYTRNIMDLVYLADIDFLICDKIYRISDPKPTSYDFLKLSANNSFFESIEILHTLIYSKDKNELRIEPAIKDIIEKDELSDVKINSEVVDKFLKFIEAQYPNPNYNQFNFDKKMNLPIGDIIAEIKKAKIILNGIDDFELLKSKFESYGFHKIRHQSAAHKNKLLPNPAGAANLTIKTDLIDKLGEIIKIIRIDCYIWFDYGLTNPYGCVIESLDRLIHNN
jgi:Txe/YoeB family toxin of Txe-Axe toxin-antitoxin module